MSPDDILIGLRKVAVFLPTPAGPFLTALADLGADAWEIAQGETAGDPVTLLELVRKKLRAEITAEWQAAIDAEDR